MAKQERPVDVVLVGFGWTAAIIAQELTDAGVQVLALERGEFRDTVPDFATDTIQDELRYAVRKQIFESPERETLTFRNSADQTALPMRHLGSFLPAAGVGGAGVHWNGQCWRFLPQDFEIRTHTEQRYGRKFIPEQMNLQDWGVTYDELEPHYDRFEYLCGVSGTAGNIGGVSLDHTASIEIGLGQPRGLSSTRLARLNCATMPRGSSAQPKPYPVISSSIR